MLERPLLQVNTLFKPDGLTPLKVGDMLILQKRAVQATEIVLGGLNRVRVVG